MIEKQERCLNCDTPLQGKFCHACGQKQIEPSERTLKYIVLQFLGSAFLLEKNFAKNLWQVLVKPGFLAKEYVQGRRTRYMAPLSIFLLINFFYFIYNPLSDFKLPLRDQFYQPYGALARKLIDEKLKNEKITFEEYEVEYWDWSLTLTKTLIILNVPITAFFLLLWFKRRKMYFTDHFIMHFIYMPFFYCFPCCTTSRYRRRLWYTSVGSTVSFIVFWLFMYSLVPSDFIIHHITSVPGSILL